MSELPFEVTLEEQLRCVEREIAMRERVYPRWVDAGRMKPDKAEYELKCMAEVKRTLQALVQQIGQSV